MQVKNAKENTNGRKRKDVAGTVKETVQGKKGSVCVMKGEAMEVYGKCSSSSSRSNPPELNGVDWLASRK